MGYETYARTDIQTSDPRAVIVLLYEGAIRFLQKATEAIGRSDRSEMSEYLIKTQKIVHFLATSLDFAQGGAVAQNLDRLYGYLRDTLNEANLHASPQKIQEAVGVLRPLLDAWRAVAQDPAAAAALEARAARPAAAPAPIVLRDTVAPADAALDSAYPVAPRVPAVPLHAVRAEAEVAAAPTGGAEEPTQETPPTPLRAPDRKAAGRAAYGLRVLA